MRKWDTLHHATEAGTDDWRTPRAFFEKLNQRFHFAIDAAASPQNAMLPKYWTKDDDALAQNWGMVRGTVWCNPPYGRNVGKWVEKAWNESQRTGAVSVLLIFARTDTKWWHDYAMRAAEIHFVRGRLRFEKPDGTAGDPSPVPSVVLVFHPGCCCPPSIFALPAQPEVTHE